MVVIVTNNVKPRFRGFLSSCMLEIAPGVYTSPKINPHVRTSIWNILTNWYNFEPVGSIIMTWQTSQHPAEQEYLSLGIPQKELVEIDGIWILRKAL